MGRTPSVALRLKGLVNWPNNVRHPFLSSYIKHIFQDYSIAEPGIRSSTTGMWINVTVLATRDNTKLPLKQHPKTTNPTLDFSKMDLEKSLGKLENRIKILTKGGTIREGLENEKQVEGNAYFKALTQRIPGGYLLAAKNIQVAPLEGLQIYRNTPIHLRVNVITNPLLNAQCLADYMAKACSHNTMNFFKVHKMLLESMQI